MSRFKIIRQCSGAHEICSICGQCRPHCVGHTNMRLQAEPVYAPEHGTPSDTRCAALIAVDKKTDTSTQVGRTDTAMTREVEDDQARNRRKPVKAAA